MGDPMGDPYPHGYGYGGKSIPASVYGWPGGVIFVSWVWVWGSNTRWVFTHCHLYSSSMLRRSCSRLNHARYWLLAFLRDWSRRHVNYAILPDGYLVPHSDRSDETFMVASDWHGNQALFGRDKLHALLTTVEIIATYSGLNQANGRHHHGNGFEIFR
jgi:hypothetical protein